ncbi:hypothetical protein FACS1894185_1760 [Betaproteobacteria bacterium]|nr:hypothetical protein FACS1894185_1760 [Betaproteobacteria bacterium]
MPVLRLLMPEPTAYLFRPAIVVPVLLSTGAVALAATINVWALVALPCIALGSVCAAPNLNFSRLVFQLVSVMH